MRLNLLKLSLLAAVLTAAVSSRADAVGDLPVTTVNNRSVRCYEVKQHETIYSLAKRFGLTQDELIQLNPSLAEGLKAGMTIYLPDAEENIVHKVEKGETIYGLSKRYGVTPEQIVDWNPDAADGLRKGMTLRLYPSAGRKNDNASTATPPSSAVGNTHLVKPGETFYSISRAYGLTLSQLEDANPDVGVLKAGDTLIIPTGATAAAIPATTPVIERNDTTGLTPDSGNRPALETTPISIAIDEMPSRSNPARIAVLLPFMLADKKIDKVAQRSTEFYKGFLVGVDSLKASGQPIAVYAYDTSASADTVRAILSKPELQNVQAIIAPDSETDLAIIADWGLRNNINVFNSFVVKDTLQLSNPMMLQGNLPTDDMYAAVIDAMMRNYPSAEIVILSREGGANDKQDFVNLLVERLKQDDRNPLYLKFTDKLKESDFTSLPGGKQLLFVPVSGRQTELNKILGALVALKEKAQFGDDVQLLGYPEWITFRGETLTLMQQLGATVYSRFYLDEEDPATKALDAKFTKWYGSAMQSGVPRQSVRGFDAAMYLIPALRSNNGDFSRPVPMYMGLQNGYNFVKAAPEGGYVNNMVYFITFHPGGIVNKVLL